MPVNEKTPPLRPPGMPDRRAARRSPLAAALPLLTLVGALATTLACSTPEDAAAGAAAETQALGATAAATETTRAVTAESSSARTYRVRGVVIRLPDPQDPLSDLTIRHEPIPDFTGIDGERVGMKSMPMPFPIGEQVSLAGLAPGDKVAFTLEVDWQGEPAYQISRIEKLDPGVELSFDDPDEAAAESTAEPAAGGGLEPDPELYPVKEPPVT